MITTNNGFGCYKLHRGKFKYFFADSTPYYIINELELEQIFPFKVLTNKSRCSRLFRDRCLMYGLKNLLDDKGLIDNVERNITDWFMKEDKVNKVYSNFKMAFTLKELSVDKSKSEKSSKQVYNFKGYSSMDGRTKLELKYFQGCIFLNTCSKISKSWLEDWMAGENMPIIPSCCQWKANTGK